jgi:hypothetical protein
MLPYSQVGYQSSSTVAFGSNTVDQTIEGHGGITSLQMGLSYELLPAVVAGISAHYLFGTIYDDQSLSFTDPNFYGGSFNESQKLNGLAITFGVIDREMGSRIGLKDTYSLSVGATFFTGGSLTLEKETLRNFSTHQDTIVVKNKNLYLPFGFGLGTSLAVNRTLYTADMYFQNWNSFTAVGKHPSELQNSLRVGIGAEFLPALENTEGYFNKLTYRAGAYFNKTNLVINGNSINEIFGTLGVGLPISGDAKMNIGFEYGMRGTTSSSLLKESIVRLTVAVTISEYMFIPPEIE